MNTKLIVVGIFSLIAVSAFSQEPVIVERSPAATEEVKVVEKEIRKEVRMEDNDGVKTLTIITEDKGVVTEEVFEGAAAEAKLAELMPQMEQISEEIEQEEERFEVQVDKEGNLQSVTVMKTRNGEVTTEVFEGEEAQKKLEELKSQTGVKLENEEKVVVKKKKKSIVQKETNIRE